MGMTIEEYEKKRNLDSSAIEREKKALSAKVDAYELAEARKELGLTQVQMAKNMGVSQKRISEIERGRAESIRLGTLERYASALGGMIHLEIEYSGQDGEKHSLKIPTSA